MIEELFFSVIDLNRSPSLKKAIARVVQENSLDGVPTPTAVALAEKKRHLWAIWDGQPTLRSPILSDLVKSRDEIVKIAEQYGLDEKINYETTHEFNNSLETLVKRSGYLISHQKRGENYIFGVWENNLGYLCDEEPIYLNEKLPESELAEEIKKFSEDNPYAATFNGSYVKNYITKREARRKFSAPPSSNTSALEVEFMYADHNECYYTPRTLWRKHRVVKKTDTHIFIEKFPFCGNGYLRQGWQARVIYTIMLKREAIESSGEFYHHSYRMHFFNKKTAKRKTRRFFEKENYKNEFLYEVPSNGLQWALSTLSIASWPTTADLITKAFRVAAMKHHPDRGGSAEAFVKCKTAQEFLIDSLK